MDLDQRNAIVDLVEGVLIADGEISEDERAFLKKVLARSGLTEGDREDRVVTSTAGRTTGTLRAFPPDVQAKIVGLLVDAAIADGKVVPEERALLLSAAAALGIDAQVLEDRIAKQLGARTSGG